MENARHKITKETVITWIAGICVILGVVAFFIGLYLTSKETNGFTLANLGNFGSYAQGTVASFWSLGALFFLYATLLAQRKQINQQESQLEQQRIQFDAEQKRQKVENEQQEKQFQLQQQAIQLQNFETSFFQLLQILNQAIADLKDYEQVRMDSEDEETITHERRECFMYWNRLLKNDFAEEFLADIARANLSSGSQDDVVTNVSETSAKENIPLPKHVENEMIVNLYYEKFYEKRQELLGHYFRILYHIVKFVDLSNELKTYPEKRRYVSLVRAQLSAYELLLIFYNGISTKATKFKPLIQEYGLLEHLDKNLLLHESHIHFYNKRAYE